MTSESPCADRACRPAEAARATRAPPGTSPRCRPRPAPHREDRPLGNLHRHVPDAARRGFEYWDKIFWTPDFAPRYYHDRDYPFDTHCSAQGILTYLAFGELKKANSVAQWAIDHMWDARGFFWYQRSRWFTNRLCYMRWTQAWMYYALAELIKANANR